MADYKDLIAQVKDLNDKDLEAFGTELPQKLTEESLKVYVDSGMPSAISSLPAGQKADAVKLAVSAQSPDEQAKIIKHLGGPAVGPATQKARDRVWLIVIIAFAIVLVGSFATLACGVFWSPGGSIKPELILTMFTSVVGFLAGLFTPSPVTGQDKG